MAQCDREDLVCLYLDALEDAAAGALEDDLEGDAVASPARTAAGIGDALELGDAAASRVALLETLSDLEADGRLVAVERPVAGYEAPRMVYALTEEGRRRARKLRETLAAERVVVDDGTDGSVTLANVERYFEDEPAPLVTALVRRTDDGRVSLDRHVGAQFVDRREPLATVTGAITASFNRESRTVVVGGPAGMGKTALVEHAIEDVMADRPDVLAARGAPPAGAAPPYAAFRQVFSAIPDVGDLAERLEDARMPGDPDDSDELAARRRTLFEHVADGVRDAALQRPIVVFLDNLQRADDATLELFAHLATTIDELVSPVAFVATYRTPAVAGTDHSLSGVLDRIDADGVVERVDLGGLGRADTRTLLADEVGRRSLPEGFVDRVYDRTGGNPLFVRETATHLLETGQIDPDAGRYPTSPSEITLPGAVADQIDRRLDVLDDASRELLRLGAVVGERIPGDVLAAASDLPTATRREYVDVLSASRIWEPVDDATATSTQRSTGDTGSGSGAPGVHATERPSQRIDSSEDATERGVDAREPPEDPGRDGEGGGGGRDGEGGGEGGVVSAGGRDDVQFVSGSFREAVVDRIPSDRTRALHERVGAAFREVEGDAQAARIAHHYERAGDHETAVTYYRRAGTQAAGAYAHRDAIASLRRAVALAREHDVLDDHELGAVLAELAGVHRTIGDVDTARETAAEGLDVAPPQSRAACELLGTQSAAAFDQGEYETARTLATRERSLAEAIDALDLAAAAIRRLGLVARNQGRYDRAREHFQRCLGLAQRLEDRHLIARTLNGLGTVMLYRDEFALAREYHDSALAIARELEDSLTEGQVLTNLGLVGHFEGAYDEAREYYAEALEISRDIGDRAGEAKTLHNLGTIADVQGDLERARECYEASIEIEREIGDRAGEARTLNNLGEVVRVEGDVEAARAYYERCLEIASDVGDRQSESKSLLNLATLARQDGEYGTARERLARARERFEEMGDASSLTLVDLEAGRLALERDDVETARTHLDAATAVATDRGDVGHRARCRKLAGRVALAADDRTGARDEWTTALELFERVDDHQRALETLEHLVDVSPRDSTRTEDAQAAESGRGEAGAVDVAARARELLAEASPAVADRHREWIEATFGGDAEAGPGDGASDGELGGSDGEGEGE